MKNYFRLILLIFLFFVLSLKCFANNEFYPAMTIIKNVTVSSYLIDKNQSKFAYHPINLIDEDNSTAWFKGVKGDGIGEWVKFDFITPVNINQIYINNGYGKSVQLFKANNRVKQIEVTTNNPSDKEIFDLEDNLNKQSIKFTVNNISFLRITIKSIYKGDEYSDTGMSEVGFDACLAEKNIQADNENKEAIFNSFDKIDFYKGGDISAAGVNKFFKDNLNLLNSSLVKELFERKYPPLDGAGNDERFYSVLNGFKKYPQFIPSILKVIYDKSDNGFFVTESSNVDSYSIAARILLSNEMAIPLMIHSGTSFYDTYYYILNLGDTKIVPLFLNELIKTGIWHEATCDLMPSEILIQQKDAYSRNIVKQYLKEKTMSDGVRKELEKALAGM